MSTTDNALYRAPLDLSGDEDFMIFEESENLSFELVLGNEWLSQKLPRSEVEKVRDILNEWLKGK